MNRLLKVAGYLWIGSVFLWLFVVAVIGGMESVRGVVFFILIMSLMSTGIIFGGYVTIQLVSGTINLFDEKRKEELKEELREELKHG